MGEVVEVVIRNRSNSTNVVFSGRNIPDEASPTFKVQTNRTYPLTISKARNGAVIVMTTIITKSTGGGEKYIVKNPVPVGVILDGADLGINVEYHLKSATQVGQHTLQFYTTESGKELQQGDSNVSASNETLQVQMYNPTLTELKVEAAKGEGSVHDAFTEASLRASIEGTEQPDPADYYSDWAAQRDKDIAKTTAAAPASKKDYGVIVGIIALLVGAAMAYLIYREVFKKK